MYIKPIFLFLILLYNSSIVCQNTDSEKDRSTQKVVPDNYYQKSQTKKNIESINQPKSYPLAIATGFFEDPRDGKTYKWVQIGKQTWMAQNLAFLPINGQAEKDCEYWVYGDVKRDLTKIENSEMYKNKGVLYNYRAATTACPVGWRLPLDYDWLKLESFIGMEKELLLSEGPRGEVANKLIRFFMEFFWPRIEYVWIFSHSCRLL